MHVAILTMLMGSMVPLSPTAAVGDTPPDLIGRDVHHKAVHVTDYAGKVVIMDFWASWCSPCRKELSVLDMIQKQVSTDRLVVLAVNYRESQSTFTAIAHKLADEISLTLVEDSKGMASGPYGIKSIPFIVVIGPDGKIAKIEHGYSEQEIPHFVDSLNQMLSKPQTPVAP